ncbi:extracellular catalytic domain type 1 short-chain-length polyhydroxyalkanoate depolymerase [Novilysobacter antarcticus]|uniref:extracellular catalytic domain type 1 short-chain-length polyhydroxyalkanoate depolymerase n=1 Tax=Novilysobacter antarcticus TaxID=2862543 RepID=UPI001C998C88|nr:PHB depolymerase family esterase [Lysobacter antarcticus]
MQQGVCLIPEFSLKPLDSFLPGIVRATPRAGAPRDRDARGVDISATINEALTTAGLLPQRDNRSAIGPVASRLPALTAISSAAAPLTVGKFAPTLRPRSAKAPAAGKIEDKAPGGTSVRRSYTNSAGTRDYTLYIPAGLDPSTAAPLVLMLHGCTQNPDDFATGTRMNALADETGVLVAYPAQTARANGSNCWNWFRNQDQARGTGEPSILAGIVADIAQDHRVDEARVYVAGLSAGAAMAVILGRTYPDVFAAVGAHSGLPFGAATDMPGAFAAMQGRATTRSAAADASPGATGRANRIVPTIVFHGDADRTVSSSNGRAIVDDVLGSQRSAARLTAKSTRSEAGGRPYTRQTYADDSGKQIVELWGLHGAGHAWSGGDPAGSFTDASGPDASAEMLRFFLQHTNAGGT